MVQIRSLFSCAGLAVLILSPLAEAAAAPVIAPHRAVYDLSLVKAADSGRISQAHGKLEFEWADACTSWTVSQRIHVRLIATGGQVIEFGWSLSALEAYCFRVTKTIGFAAIGAPKYVLNGLLTADQ